MLEGFSNQLLSFVNALYLAGKFNLTAVLPVSLGSRHTMLVTDLLNPISTVVPFDAVYDLGCLMIKLEELGIHVTVEAPAGHVHRMNLAFHRRENLRNVLHSLSQLQHFEDIMIDVGHMFLRIVPFDCLTHLKLARLVKTVTLCLARPLVQTAESITAELHPYNAVHLRLEEDAKRVWDQSFQISQEWPTLLLNSGFKKTDALYVACGGCFVKKSVFQTTTKNGVQAFQRSQVMNMSGEHDVMAAVDLHVLVAGERFAGSSFSAFSHLIVSMRRIELPIKLVNYDIFGSPTGTFEDNTNIPFGSSSPDPSCNPLRLQSLVSYSQQAFAAEQSFAMRTFVRSEGQLSAPEFYSAVAALWWRQSSTSVARNMFASASSMVTFRSDAALQRLLVPALLISFPTEMIDYSHQRKFRILFMTHTTRYEGAPIAMSRLATLYTRVCMFDVTVQVNPSARGALEAELADAGINIRSSLHFDPIDYDVIIANTIVGWFTPPRTPWLHKTIIWVHESFRNSLFDAYPHMPALMREAHSLIFVTNRSRAVYADIISTRTGTGSASVIPNALVPELLRRAQEQAMRTSLRASLGIENDGLIFIQSGTVNQERNQLNFVMGAIEVLRANPGRIGKLKFIIIGFTGQPEYVEYENRVRQSASPFPENFVMLPKLAYLESLTYLVSADVYTSLSTSESFGFTLVEAMTVGIPLCVSKVDGVPDVVYQEAVDVFPVSAGSVAACFTYFLEKRQRSRHSRLAFAHSRRFAVEAHFYQHLEVLRSYIYAEGLQG
jgi:glycosyltransferase involved in cell wall biosynthesis